MDFEFSEEHKMLRDAIRDFAEKEIAALVDEAEEKEKFPVELFSKMGELGYLCVSYPVEYGAAGMGMVGECIVIEEIAKISAGITAKMYAKKPHFSPRRNISQATKTPYIMKKDIKIINPDASSAIIVEPLDQYW